MNNRGRKFVWPAVIILAGIYFGPSVIRFFVPIAVRLAGQQRSGKPADQNAGSSPGPSAPQAALVPVADDPALARYLGKWQGMLAVPNRGSCTLRIEMRDNHNAERPFAAFSSLSCVPSMMTIIAQHQGQKVSPAVLIDETARQMNPTSAILSGGMKDGSLKLLVDKNIGVAEIAEGCPMDSITITPFGAEQMAIEWKESGQGICQGGQMLMGHQGR